MSLKIVVLKAAFLFLVFNFLFAVLDPIPELAKISGYNSLFPGRTRLPFGETPDKAYNFSLFQLEAMLRSHELAALPRDDEEIRIVLIGDSSVWGYLLKHEQTLSAFLNRLELADSAGRKVRFYNLGYPTMSLTKDLLILSQALSYQPDMVIWLFTLESFPRIKQLTSPIVQHNPEEISRLLQQYPLHISLDDPAFIQETFWNKTLANQRRALADLIRLQVYGIMWAATGIDQYYPDTYEPPQADLEADELFQGMAPPRLNPDDLALDVLTAGSSLLAGKPLILVNEPIYISRGLNSDLRYNFFYPRWAYDQYRLLLENFSREQGLPYLDAWNLVPPEEFTNSAIHLSPMGTSMLAEAIGKLIQTLLRP